jgi:hypothetical protein
MVGRFEHREHAPRSPGEPLRRLSESLLAAEIKRAPMRITVTFGSKGDASDAMRVLIGLQDAYRPER